MSASSIPPPLYTRFILSNTLLKRKLFHVGMSASSIPFKLDSPYTMDNFKQYCNQVVMSASSIHPRLGDQDIRSRADLPCPPPLENKLNFNFTRAG